MARGRKPKPPRLHVVAGTHRPDRHGDPKGVPEPEKARGLEPPAHLDQVAREEWGVVAPQLEALGLLAKVDRQVLAGYCITVSTVVSAEKEIDEFGLSFKTLDEEGRIIRAHKNPAVTVRDEALRQMRAFASEFGLTPSARARVSIAPRVPTGSGKDGEATGHHKASTAGRLLD